MHTEVGRSVTNLHWVDSIIVIIVTAAFVEQLAMNV